MFRVADCEIIEESSSGKTFKVRSSNFDNRSCTEWIPKSAIHDDSEIWKLGQEPGELVIEDWLAESKGWR